MSESNPQYVDSLRSESITISESGSRLRLSASILKRINWADTRDEFDCIGLIRCPGELLCAPSDMVDQESRHPFHAALGYRSLRPTSDIPMLDDVPTAVVLTAPDRMSDFGASWNTKRTQLTLKVGVRVMRELGWDTGSKVVIRATNWGPILLLLSADRYSRLREADFTGGHLNI